LAAGGQSAGLLDARHRDGGIRPGRQRLFLQLEQGHIGKQVPPGRGHGAVGGFGGLPGAGGFTGLQCGLG